MITLSGLESETRDRRISLTPLIDVVFILLVFFMLETTFRGEGGVHLQSSTSGSGDAAERLVVIEIFDEQTIWVDGQRLSYAEWAPRHENFQAAVVEVRTEQQISIQRIVDVNDKLNQLGAKRVQLGQVQVFR